MAQNPKFNYFMKLAIVLGALFAAGLYVFVTLNLSLKSGEVIDYSNGVVFFGSAGEGFSKAKWGCRDFENPEPCPFSVRLPDGDLDAEHLAAFDRLRSEGWEQVDHGTGIELRRKDLAVRCRFVDRKLIDVEVNGPSKSRGTVKRVSIIISGKNISLPASRAAIVQALGPSRG